MPERNYRRVMPVGPRNKIGRISNDGRGLENERDVIRQDRRGEDLQRTTEVELLSPNPWCLPEPHDPNSLFRQ